MEKEAGFWIRVVAVDGVADDGGAEIFQMDAELVSAAGGGFEFEERIFIILGEGFVISLGRLAVLADLESGRTFQIAGDWQVNHGFGELRMAFDDGVVSFVGLAVLELLAEHGLSLGVFRENDDSTGVAVKAMNEEAVIFEGGLGTIFAFRHAEETGGLVDDEDVVIFVDDGRARRSFCGFGN